MSDYPEAGNELFDMVNPVCNGKESYEKMDDGNWCAVIDLYTDDDLHAYTNLILTATQSTYRVEIDRLVTRLVAEAFEQETKRDLLT